MTLSPHPPTPDLGTAAPPPGARKPIASSSVVAVIPAYNEERFIASVVLRAKRVVETVIVVDDGSSDRTADLAESVGAFVVRLERNSGKAEALNQGFRAALGFDPDAIVCLDGDAQHDPDEIPDLAAPILDGRSDVVVGSRFLDKRSRIPAWRQVGQHTLTAVTNLTSGVSVTDSQSGYRAFSRRAAQLLDFRSSHLSVESEMQFLLQEARLRVSEVPISVTYQDGNKRNPVVHGLQILDAIVSLVARRRPLAFIALPGVALCIAGLLFGLRVIHAVNARGELLLGSAVLTSLLLIVGLVMALGGMTLHTIHHLVRRLQDEVLGARGAG